MRADGSLVNAVVCPAVWLPTIRAGTGADVFTERLRDALNSIGLRAEIAWLPHRAEYLPWSVPIPKPPAWVNVVHVNSWLPRRFWPRSFPVVVTVHHLVHDPAYRAYRSRLQAAYHALLIRRRELHAIRDAAAVSAVSDYVRRTVIAFSGRKDVAAIYNWIDVDRFSPLQDALAGATCSFRLFMAGSHSRRKGIDLLPAFVNELGGGVEVRYAGGEARTTSATAGVTELGRIDESELIREYQECDAVVSLSRYEGFGYTAVEAMACGKPFLGFATSALSQVVPPACGRLVSVDDVAALSAAVQELRAHRASAAALGKAGRQHVIKHFSPHNVQAYIDLYQSAAKASGAQQARAR